MASVIDSLVITLGLDSSQFRKDQVAVADSSKKLKESLVKDGKDVEKSGKDAAESWGALRKEILGTIAAFIGLDAIKNAVGDVTKFNKELSQSAQAIGVSAQELSAWGMAVERMGGDANSARASLQHLADIFNELKSGKASPETFFWFSRLMAEGGVKLNAAKPMLEQLPQIAEGLKNIAATQGAARAIFVGKQLGLDEGTIRLLMQGKDAVKAIVENMRKLAPTAEQIDKTNQLYQAWVSLRQTFDSATNILVSRLSPALTWLVNKTRELIEEWRSGNVFEKWDKLSGGTVKKIYDEWMELGRKIKEMWLAIPKALGQSKDLITDAFKDAWKDAFDWLKGKFDWLKSAWNWVRGNFGVGSAEAHEAEGGAAGGLTPGRGIKLPHRGGEGGPPATSKSVRRGATGGTPDTPAPAPGEAGKYRPVYKLSDSDLSDKVVNTIAGEAHTNNQQSVDAVINNMLNRVGTKTYGPSGNIEQVARAPGQYAGYRRASAKEAAYIRARIKAIASGGEPDITNGSNEYRAGYYHGPWYQHHRDAPVIGGNRFAYNPKGGRGSYSPYAGARNHPRPNTLGAPGAAGARSSINNSPTTNSSNSETNINGGITIHTQATDAPGLMREMQAHIDRQNYTAQANYGIA